MVGKSLQISLPLQISFFSTDFYENSNSSVNKNKHSSSDFLGQHSDYGKINGINYYEKGYIDFSGSTIGVHNKC